MKLYDGPQFEEGIVAESAAQQLNPLMSVVYLAGQVTKKEFLIAEENGSFDLVSKEDGSPVTRVDYATRDALREGFRREGISGYHDDEEGQAGDKADTTVIVTDPVDGTQNLLLGLRGFFTNVCGVYENGDLTASLVNDPMNDQLFVAGKGAGMWKFGWENNAWSQPQRLHMPNLSANPAERPFLLTDTKVYEEDRTLAKALEIIGYRPEPTPGSGKKMSLLVSRPNVAGMFRSQRGNPDPHDIAAASLFVTEAGGKVTSLGGDALLDDDLKFYDGYAFGNETAHRDIITTSAVLKDLFSARGLDEGTITKQQSDDLAKEAASVIRSRFYA